MSAVNGIDQKHAPGAFERLERRALLQQPHLRDGDLAQRAVRSKRQEVRVGAEQKRVFVALFSSPFFALGDKRGIGFQAQVVLFDLGSIVVQELRREAPREGGFPHAFGAGQEQRLGDSVAPDHVAQGGGDGGVSKKAGQGLTVPLATHATPRSDRARPRSWIARRDTPAPTVPRSAPYCGGSGPSRAAGATAG